MGPSKGRRSKEQNDAYDEKSPLNDMAQGVGGGKRRKRTVIQLVISLSIYHVLGMSGGILYAFSH